MAANDEYPRGGSIYVANPGTVTIPASQGIAHVLEAIRAQLILNGVSGEFEITVTSNSLGTIHIGQVTGFSAAAGQLVEDTLLETLNITGGVGEALNVVWNGAIIAGQAGYLGIHFHDI